MKKLVIICMMLGACVAGKAQNTRGTENGVKQPNIVVVPFSKEGQDIRKIIEDNAMMSLAMSKVKEEFNNRGFITKDFIAMLKALKTDDVMMDDSQMDVKARIVQSSKADIQVVTKITVNKRDQGAAEVSLELEAVEVQTANSLANKSFLSGEFITNDSIRLANRALSMISDDFFGNLQSAFNQMVEEGRELNMSLSFAKDCEMDATSEVGSNGNDLQMEIEEWLSQNAYKGVYGLNGSGKLLDISMQVPLFDQETGNPFNLSRMRTMIKRFLDPLLKVNGCLADVVVRGQKLNVTIKLNDK